MDGREHRWFILISSAVLDDQPGVRAALKGLWHAHLGWLFNRELTSDPVRYCPDIARDKDMRFISKYFIWFVVAGIALPALLGFALTWTIAGVATGALWGGTHAFPRAASHGFRWYEVDISALIIRVLERLGLVWDVIRIDRERQEYRGGRLG